MIEAKVECTCSGFYVSDLNLYLSKGQVVWLQEEKARASVDLQHAKRVGAVSVVWKERCEVEVSRSPSPPWLNRNNQKALRREALGKRQEAAPMDMDEVSRRAAEAAEAAVASGMESIREMVRTELQGSRGAVDAATLEGMLRNALSGVQPGVPSMPTTRGNVPSIGAEPVFIPTGIVPINSKAEISVSSASTSDSGLDDAMAALKAAKKKRPKVEE